MCGHRVPEIVINEKIQDFGTIILKILILSLYSRNLSKTIRKVDMWSDVKRPSRKPAWNSHVKDPSSGLRQLNRMRDSSTTNSSG